MEGGPKIPEDEYSGRTYMLPLVDADWESDLQRDVRLFHGGGIIAAMMPYPNSCTHSSLQNPHSGCFRFRDL